MKNYQAILMAVGGIGLAVATMMGELQKVIPFAGVANEMGFTFAGMIMGILGIVAIDYRKLIKALL
jgi:hypothetical protein